MVRKYNDGAHMEVSIEKSPYNDKSHLDLVLIKA